MGPTPTFGSVFTFIMARSRLSKRVEAKTKKNLFLSILGIVLIFFLAFKFGIPFLVNISLFLAGAKDTQEQTLNENPGFIAPPILDAFPSATKSAEILITGFASKNQIIHLYINDELIDRTEAEDDGSFRFEETITPGEIVIKAKAIEDKNESEFSNIISTAFKDAPPSLAISSPSDGQSFPKDEKSAEVTGTTGQDVRITVNGFWAITDSAGNFSYTLPLQGGENMIKIVATDTAGNKSEKEIKVTYNP